MPTVYVYIHICCINNWKDIFFSMISDIKESGLYDKTTEIRCNILTTNYNDISFFEDEKIKIIGVSDNLDLYETPTLNFLWEHSMKEDFYALYLHTKGVKHNNENLCVNDWVKYMKHFNIYKHENCISELANYDTVGVNLQHSPRLHYSGNFWWAKSQYLRKLNKCIYLEYHSPEFWLTEKQLGNYLCVWASPPQHHHYCQRYEENNYINGIINNKSKYSRVYNLKN